MNAFPQFIIVYRDSTTHMLVQQSGAQIQTDIYNSTPDEFLERVVRPMIEELLFRLQGDENKALEND